VVASLYPDMVAPGEGSAVELRSSRRVFPQTIEHIAVSGQEAVIAFSGAHTISEALRFVGCSLWAEVPAPKADSAAGLLGFQVFDLQGNCWGTVKSLPRFSLNQLLEVADPISGETAYVPWHRSLVVRIDRGARTMVIDPPAGLRDLNK
jgi:ribosomal 30S subunit maturation factor RimM